MDIRNLFRKNIEPSEKKASSQAVAVAEDDDNSIDSIVGMLEEQDQWNMSFDLLNQYFKRCAPLACAMNEISDAGCEIQPRLWNKKTEQYVDNHPFIELLSFPSSGISGGDFRRSIIANHVQYGNQMLRLIGPNNAPPLELKIDLPQFAEINPDSNGEVKDIKIQNEFGARSYYAETVERRRRLRRGTDDEIWHIMSYNPDEGTRSMFGAPLARPLYNNIEIIVFGGEHNKMSLKRGARPSGAISIADNEMMTDEDWRKMKTRIQTQIAGYRNTGAVVVMQNGKFEQLSMTNKDMDYKHLLDSSTVAIFRHFKIPLPIVLADTMTMGNYSTAQTALYDRAVMPVVRFIFEQLWCACGYRYEKNWQDYILTFDENDIPALVTRRYEQMVLLSKAGVLEINELRDQIGHGPTPGGNTIWRPTSEAPILETNTDEETDGDDNGTKKKKGGDDDDE